MKKLGTYLLYFLVIVFIVLTTLYSNNLENLKHAFLNFFSPKPQEEIIEKGNEKPQTLHLTDEHDSKHEDEQIVKLTDEQIKEMGLQLQTAAPGKLILTLSTRGNVILDPDRLAHIIPKIPGIVRETRKNIGNSVKAGEVIAILESQGMADLKAAYLAALNKEKLTASMLAREENLYQQGISPGQDYLNSLNAYEEARINLQLSRQKLRAFGLNDHEMTNLAEQHNPDLRFYEIYAPIDGTVIMRHVTKGEFIDNASTIYKIADLSNVWVEIGIYPKDLYRIKEGQMVEVVNTEENLSAQAELIYVSPIIANETMISKAIALLDNPHGDWHPGSYVKVHIATDQIYSPLVISKEAVQKIEGTDCVFALTEKGFEKRPVKFGLSNRRYVEVLSGLLPGEKYVANNPFLLKAELNKESAEDEH